MKTNPKAGDKVKCIDNKGSSLELNKIYTVNHILLSHGVPYLYIEGITSTLNGFLPSRFVLVPDTKFKVGDKVKCINPTCLLTLNKIYEVKGATHNGIYIDRDDDFGVAEYFTDGISDGIRFVKVEETPKKTPEKVTEVVTIKGNVDVIVRKDYIVVNGIIINAELLDAIADAIEYVDAS